MKSIKEVFGPGPESFIEKYGESELKKTQSDPEYMVREYLMESGDQLTREESPHPHGTRIDLIVTEPDGHWIKLKFLEKKD